MSSSDLTHSGTCICIDGRDMQPPEPLEKTIAALEILPAGGELRLLLYCHPVPLFNILRNNGYTWQMTTLDDGTNEILIRHA